MSNDLVVIGAPEPLNALAVYSGGIAKVIESIEAGVRAEPWDVSTPQGRQAMKSFAYKIARSKTALDDAGKTLTEDIARQKLAIDKDRKFARDRLDVLKTEFLKPLTEIEEEEYRTQNELLAMLAQVTVDERYLERLKSEEIEQCAERMKVTHQTTDWRHFKQRAADTLEKSLAICARFADIARAMEAEAAKFAAEQAEKEEAARIEQVRLQKEREEKIAAEATQKAEEQARRREADNEMQHQAMLRQAERQKEEAERRHAEQLAQAEQNRKEAIAAEVARQNREKEAAELEAQRLENDKKRRAKVHNEILEDLIKLCGLTEAQGKLVITKAAQRGLRNVRIIY